MTIAINAVYEDGVLKPEEPVNIPDKSRVRVIIETSEVARTPLGKRLRELRAEILGRGEATLDWTGIEDEVAARRGGWREDR
jgi:predicted DNA-binding antitoxin AbrB/MazE fold protein